MKKYLITDIINNDCAQLSKDVGFVGQKLFGLATGNNTQSGFKYKIFLIWKLIKVIKGIVFIKTPREKKLSRINIPRIDFPKGIK